jgi:hypothetical protein
MEVIHTHTHKLFTKEATLLIKCITITLGEQEDQYIKFEIETLITRCDSQPEPGLPRGPCISIGNCKDVTTRKIQCVAK